MTNVPAYYEHKGLAMRGYDMVHLLENKELVRGTYSHHYQGQEWRFVSEHNKAAFAERPEKYLPAYGGYCAWGASNGYKAHPRMDAWAIVEGRLYFNFSHYIKEHWQQDTEAFIALADQQWEETKETTPIKANPTIIYLKYLLKGKRFFD